MRSRIGDHRLRQRFSIHPCGRHRVGGQCADHLADPEDFGSPRDGLVESDRHVRRARGQHTEDGDYLVGPLGSRTATASPARTPSARRLPATASACRPSCA